jgi:C1A family cysteine protease
MMKFFKQVKANGDFEVGFNDFLLLTDKEYKNLSSGFIDDAKRYLDPRFVKTFPVDNLPKSIDWNAKGLVSKPKNQGNCSSCYAFSVASAIETYSMIHNKGKFNLSAQQFIDCTIRE